MNTIKLHFKLVAAMMAVVFMLASCDDDDTTMVPTMDIVEIAQADTNFSTLVAAVVKADLVTTLKSAGPYTVFAPTNAAFTALINSLTGVNSLDDLDSATLAPILLYHVVSGEVMAGSLMDGQVVDPVGSGTFTIDLSTATQPKITDGAGNSVNITATDIEATNGVIHVIDGVILP